MSDFSEMPADRLVTPDEGDEERLFDANLRPKSLDEYIGQAAMREKLEIYIEAARRRQDALDHVLIFAPPGLGKTTLASSLSRSIGGSFRRVQFTSDLLPSDIIGVSVVHPDMLSEGWTFADDFEGATGDTVAYLTALLQAFDTLPRGKP